MVSAAEEAQLVELLKLGDEQAVDIWYSKYHAGVKQFIARKVEQKAECEELVQQTFINCIKHIHIFAGRSSLRTWMCAIAHHEIADYYRKKYAKKALATMPLATHILDAKMVDRHELDEAVAHVLSQMKETSRELLLLKYVDKKQVAVIAEELGRTVKSVESDLFRARREFKVAFSKVEAEI